MKMFLNCSGIILKISLATLYLLSYKCAVITSRLYDEEHVHILNYRKGVLNQLKSQIKKDLKQIFNDSSTKLH